MNQENKEQSEKKGFIEKAKDIIGKLPSISFTKQDPEDPSGRTKLRGFWISWRF
jgi:hypothetical protein